MTEFRNRLLGTVLGTSIAYAVLAASLAITGGEPSTGVYWSLPLAWPVWQTAVAIRNIRDMAAEWHSRRRPAPRPVSLADYMPGSTSPQPRVNRAA